MGSGDPNDTLMRQLQMLQLIPRYPRGITTAELAGRLDGRGFQVHPRTIQRDLVKLSLVFQLFSNEGRPALWSWVQTAPALAIPHMDSHCALVFWLMRQQLQPQLPKTTVQWLEPYFKTAAMLLDGLSEHQALNSWRNKIRVLHRGPLLQPAVVDAEVESSVYDALLHNRCLTVRYTRRWDQVTKVYEIHPLGLVLKEGIAYLVSTMGDCVEIRLFALHRMKSAAMLDEPVSMPNGFDLDGYIATGELSFSEGEMIQLKAVFTAYTALHLEERPLSVDQTLEVYGEDHRLLTATVQNSLELQWWLLGFGDQVEVLEPASLRQKFLLTARALLAKYDHGRERG